MRHRLSILLGTFLCTALIVARSLAAESIVSEKATEVPSAFYLAALRTANEFLSAWVNRDEKTGIELMSSRLREEIKDKYWLQQYMVGLSNPHHQAFEIRRVSGTTNRYVFSVLLYEFYTGEPTGIRYESLMEVVKQGTVWRIDHLPRSSDNLE